MSDYLSADPPDDGGVPASTPAVTFESGGEKLLGVLHLPAGDGPHPIVVLCHGFPGNERNFDLAQALRRAGFAALVFHYRGSWGVGGSYSWTHVLEDSARVVAAVPHDDRLDPGRLAVVGHSSGGFAALMTAAADPSVRAVVSIAGFDFGAAAMDRAGRADRVAAWDDSLLPLKGTSGEALVAEAETAGEKWQLARLGPKLTGRPVLLIAGTRDDVAPIDVHHRPLVAAYQAAEQVFPTDHALSDHRVALTRAVVEFLAFLGPGQNP